MLDSCCASTPLVLTVVTIFVVGGVVLVVMVPALLLTLVTFRSMFFIWYTFSAGPVLLRLGSFFGSK